jgi:hypothetical protein
LQTCYLFDSVLLNKLQQKNLKRFEFMTESEIKEMVGQLAEGLAREFAITPRWLKLTAAAKYASINKTRLKNLAIEEKILGYQDPDSTRGDWIFDKESLDDYRLEPIIDSLGLSAKADAIWEKL